MTDSIEAGSPTSPSTPSPENTPVAKVHLITVPGSRMPKGRHTFAVHKNIRTALKQRLIKEGRYDAYRSFVEALKLSGIPDTGDMAAWKIAAFAFAPISGGPGELKADPHFEKIAADWANEKYPQPPGFAKFPSGMTNFEQLASEPSPEFKETVRKVKGAKTDWDNEWRELSAQVEVENADQVTEAKWVTANRWTRPSDIDPADAPSRAAVAKLSWVQESSSNFGDFLKTFESKLLPDKKTIEYESRFKDDGRVLGLLDELGNSLDDEEDEEEAA